MAENLIVVPMELQAMVVNGRPRNFQRWQMNYKALKIFNSPEPKPFKNDSDDFSIKEENQGVYLMWTLPKALRHGYQRTVGEDTKFPLVPNRWLVVRFSGQSDKRAAKAWVV